MFQKLVERRGADVSSEHLCPEIDPFFNIDRSRSKQQTQRAKRTRRQSIFGLCSQAVAPWRVGSALHSSRKYLFSRIVSANAKFVQNRYSFINFRIGARWNTSEKTVFVAMGIKFGGKFNTWNFTNTFICCCNLETQCTFKI